MEESKCKKSEKIIEENSFLVLFYSLFNRREKVESQASNL